MANSKKIQPISPDTLRNFGVDKITEGAALSSNLEKKKKISKKLHQIPLQIPMSLYSKFLEAKEQEKIMEAFNTYACRAIRNQLVKDGFAEE